MVGWLDPVFHPPVANHTIGSLLIEQALAAVAAVATVATTMFEHVVVVVIAIAIVIIAVTVLLL